MKKTCSAKIISIEQAVYYLQQQKVIAYPTESVFGLGCDPDSEDALNALLLLKRRPKEKGLILVAADYKQLLPYIDDSILSDTQRHNMLQSWSNSVITWLIPKQRMVSALLSGQFDTLAVRVSQHPLVKSLCTAYGKPLVSTSANLSGYLPCKTVDDIYQQFGCDFPVLYGKVGGSENPSEIRHSLTNQIVRRG